MLRWTIKDNLISALWWDKGRSFIQPWGVETADSWSFFSLEKEIGYRYHLRHHVLESEEKKLKQTMEVMFHGGRFELFNQDELGPGHIKRTSQLKALENSHFMDFVQRYRFKKEFFDFALINGQKIFHTNSNIYHQHKVHEAHLVGKELKIKISIEQCETAGKFVPHMYVRDRGDEWIVHVRMLPLNEDMVVIKLCSKYFKTSPLPLWLCRFLLSWRKIRQALLYRSERLPYTSRLMRFFSPNAFLMGKLEKGECLSWTSKMEVE